MTTPSRSTASPSDLIQVLVDTREPDWVRALTFEGAHVIPAVLEVGDALGMDLGGRATLVERKTAGDLLASVKDGRLLTQAAAMRAVTDWCYLVVTEPMYPGRYGQVMYQPARGHTQALRETAWRWHAIQGALTSVQDLGVGVVWAGGDDDYERTCVWLMTREKGPVALPRREAVLLPDEEAILCSLPGVGPARAKDLLRACGSPAWALYALTEIPRDGKYAKNVIGIGPQTRLGVRRALGLGEREALIPLEEP